jgi:hypothetical protein
MQRLRDYCRSWQVISQILTVATPDGHGNILIYGVSNLC